MKKVNPKLDKQEKKIEKALERKEFVSASNLNSTKHLFKEAAKNYKELHQTKRITIRVNQGDLIKVKAKAKRSNIPYQTLLNALIRQFAQNRTSIQI